MSENKNYNQYDKTNPSGYGQAQHGYGQAQPGYNYAQPGYGQAQPEYNYAQPGYGQAQLGYGQAQPEYNYAQHGYGQAQPGYGQAQPEYNYAQPGYGQAQHGYGQAQPEYNYAQPGYGQAQHGYGQAQHGYGQAQHGYGQAQPYGQPGSSNIGTPGMNNNMPPTASYYDYTAPQSYDAVSQWEGSRKWETTMLNAPCAEPCFCIAACFCPCCCTYMQRKKLLLDDWSRYICCAGLCGNCSCLVCKGAEPFCMCLEALCCLGCAVHGNRFMILQHYNLENDCCDTLIMCSVCICACLALILQNDSVKSLADILYYITVGCMLAQQEHQMKKVGYPKGQMMT